jgi:hypothetical protein
MSLFPAGGSGWMTATARPQTAPSTRNDHNKTGKEPLLPEILIIEAYGYVLAYGAGITWQGNTAREQSKMEISCGGASMTAAIIVLATKSEIRTWISLDSPGFVRKCMGGTGILPVIARPMLGNFSRTLLGNGLILPMHFVFMIFLAVFWCVLVCLAVRRSRQLSLFVQYRKLLIRLIRDCEADVRLRGLNFHVWSCWQVISCFAIKTHGTH